MEIDNTVIAEAAGAGAATATVTRINDTAGPTTVSLVSSDLSEATLQAASLDFLAGESSLTVLIDAVDDMDPDGSQTVQITASAVGYNDGTQSLLVTDDDTPVPSLVINEVIIDSAGSDTEFLEIYNADTVSVDIAGFSIEKWDSDSGGSFGGADGGGAITIPSGTPIILAPGEYYLMANSVFAAVPEYSEITIDLSIPNNSFENGSATFVLRDAAGNVVHTVFATDGGMSDQANIDGTVIVPDSVANTDFAFALLPDGDTSNVVEIDNGVPSTEATPGSTNGLPVMTTYTVEISSCSYAAGEFTIGFTATGLSDVYRSTDLQTWGMPYAEDVATGTYIDTAASGGKFFYLIQEAGAAAP